MKHSERQVTRALRKTWQPVCLSSALPNNVIVSRRLLGEELIVVRFPDRLLAAKDGCPHKGARFAIATVRDGEMVCGYHGWRFDAAGGCSGIPSLVDPRPDMLSRAALHTFAIRERYGMVWVRLDDDELLPLPDVPQFESWGWSLLLGEPMVFRVGFRREIENFLDQTHFAFTHGETLGADASPIAPEVQLTEGVDGFRAETMFPAEKSTGKMLSSHRREYRLYLPNFTYLTQFYPDGDERIIVHVPSPTSEYECTVFWAIALSPGFRGPSASEQLDFSTRVLDEDRVMCESQIPAEVPLQPAPGGWGVLVAPGDILANAFERKFRSFVKRSLVAVGNHVDV